jgi:hypothetical protein
MPRVLIVVLGLALLLVPATAGAHSDLRLRGTVALVDPVNHLVTVSARRQTVVLHVPGSTAAFRVGRRVELRGSTLRAHGNGSRVLARNVSIVTSRAPVPPQAPRADQDEPDDDEVETKGRITSLAPLTVQSATRPVTCAVPSGASLAGFAVGDFVEITCDLLGGTWVLRELEHEDVDEDDDEDEEEDDDDDRSGHGGGSSGHGGGG